MASFGFNKLWKFLVRFQNFLAAFYFLYFSACNFMPSQLPKSFGGAKIPVSDNGIPVVGGGSDDSDGDQPGSGSTLSGEELIYSKGVVRNLQAKDFPSNAIRKDLSGTVAKLELRYPRERIPSVGYPETLVHVRRWGPFRVTIDIKKLIDDNLSKFSCPSDFASKTSREFDRFDHSGETNQKTNNTYAEKVEIRETDPTTSTSRYYYPSAISEFVDKRQLPTVTMKRGFEYDGDRNLSGSVENETSDSANYTNDAREGSARNEVSLVPDTYYVYVFCVGDVPDEYDADDSDPDFDTRLGEYNWAQGDIRIFRATDLERPVVTDPTDYGTTQLIYGATGNYSNLTYGAGGPYCELQNDLRWAWLAINAKLENLGTGYDSSIGRLPNGPILGDRVIKLHYITTPVGSGTSFIDNPADPMDPKVDDMNAKSIGIAYAVGGLNSFGTSVTTDAAFTSLKTGGQATFVFKTNEDNVQNDKNSAANNTLIKDYLGEIIPDTQDVKNVRIAFELLIKDRSIPASSSLSSTVFSQSYDTLGIFTANPLLTSLSQMTGASFIRGETTVKNNRNNCR